jgi:hypothetical protein
MDATRFDNLARALQHHAPRRAALGVLGGGLATLLNRFGIEEIAAKKGKNMKKKPKLNEFGCVNVGGKCRGKNAHCCSGICEGKKPKKGKKDRSRCVAHNVLECLPDQDACEESGSSCGASGLCYRTTGRASFCGAPPDICAVCRKDTDCEEDFGPGAACIICEGECGPITDGTACVPAAAK